MTDSLHMVVKDLPRRGPVSAAAKDFVPRHRACISKPGKRRSHASGTGDGNWEEGGLMRRSRVHPAFVAWVVALAAAATSACNSTRIGSAGGDVAPAYAPVSVELRNENYNDMAVYVVAHGVAARIATVMGNETSTITLDPSFYEAQDMQIIARPIGGLGGATTGRLMLRPGDRLEFRIAQNLPASTIIVR